MNKIFFTLVLSVLIFGKSQAQYAVGGTSENFNKVYWLTWNPDLSNPNNPLASASNGFATDKDGNRNIISGTYTWMYSSNVRIVATVTNLASGELEPYTPGNWKGDGIGYLYSGAIDGGDLVAPQGVLGKVELGKSRAKSKA